MLREITMAAAFGTTPTVAAFWMAFRFAYLLRRLFGEGALNVAFIPYFETLRSKDSKLAARFFYDLTLGATLVLLLFIFVIESILGGILLFSDVNASNGEILRFTMLLLPALVFISLFAINTSLLNCQRSFFIPSVAPVAVNLCWICAIFIVFRFPVERALEYLAIVIVFAFILQWAVTLPNVLKYFKEEMGECWQAVHFSGKELLQILKPFTLGMLGVAATQINSALDALFARYADPQGPAYLWYAIRIEQLPLSLFGLALTGALLPPISRAIQAGDKSKYLSFLNFALKRSLAVMLPMMAALFPLGFSGISLVYGHGGFSQEAACATTRCLWGYAGSLLPSTLVLILAAAFYGQKNYVTPTVFSLCSVVFNIIFNLVFVFIFRWGAVSIALATALSTCLNATLLALALKKSQNLNLQGTFTTAWKTSLASLLALLATFWIGSYCNDNTLFWVMGREAANFPREILSQLLIFLVEASTFALTFLAAAILLPLDILPFFKRGLKNSIR
jgi:putative peptidoglycan lipid II flippase